MRFNSDEELLNKLSAELEILDQHYADVAPPPCRSWSSLLRQKQSAA